MALGGSDALPLDNLDDHIKCEDALFAKAQSEWGLSEETAQGL